ncbi:hypothetical protein diail_6570 [Diaporthe ilicicola]|nr:hypothetical protein diail_6570 [Diaporthe ilicicola]
MDLSAPCPPGGIVFHHPSSGRRRHRRHHPSDDSDTDSTYSSDSDSDDASAYYQRLPCPLRRRRRWPWPRGVLAYPGYAGWGGSMITGPAAPGLASAAAVIPPQQPQPQPQPRRYGYRRFHYQGGERLRGGCGAHGHGHQHHHHHHHRHRRGRSPRRCILPRFGRWLFGDPPERRRWCDHGTDCCDEGCGAGTTPTMHHEDEYWGPGHAGNIPNWAYGPDAHRNSSWRYGGPTNGNNNGPDIGPGGTVEEVEESGTAPIAAATDTAAGPYDAQHTHYHLNDDYDYDRRRRRRHGRRHDRRHDGVLGLVEQERRRDTERHMADADASYRREALMMGLVDRERERDRGARSTGLDVLGVLEGELERRQRRREAEGDVGGGGDGGWRGAFDALSRRIDGMVLAGGREGGSSGRREEQRMTGSRKTPSAKKAAPAIRFSREGNSDGSTGNSNVASTGSRSPRGKGVAAAGNITFSRQGDDNDADDDEDTDGGETSGPSSQGGGRGVRERGRALRRAGSPSTSLD